MRSRGGQVGGMEWLYIIYYIYIYTYIYISMYTYIYIYVIYIMPIKLIWTVHLLGCHLKHPGPRPRVDLQGTSSGADPRAARWSGPIKIWHDQQLDKSMARIDQNQQLWFKTVQLWFTSPVLVSRSHHVSSSFIFRLAHAIRN